MNLDLSNTEQRQLTDALTDIAVARDQLNMLLHRDVVRLLPAAMFDEVRAYVGTINDAHWRACEILFNDDVREPDQGPSIDEAAVVVAVAFDNRPGGDRIYRDTDWNKLLAQAERGVITRDEFLASSAVYWTERDMDDADPLAKIDWLYDNLVFDDQMYREALCEFWTEHVVANYDNDNTDRHDPDNCVMCVHTTAESWARDYFEQHQRALSAARHPANGK